MNNLQNEIQALIDTLQLQPHPEGGFYVEMYRSEEYIPGKERSLLTSIYFLLTSGNVSRFHRIKSDELWYFHQGNAVTVHTLDENGHKSHLLGNNILGDEKPYLLVPANTIFGSCLSVENGYALVSCAVAPGFDFSDFELFTAEDLIAAYPNDTEIIYRLT